ncbi:hypothetical protein LIER_31973 [Lithospermum erythrorhizon]|uniref:Uncharacterized protein n=1 Tax=Lithospermum erythrorhizon TaxID=34254 RepID=A0AAV3RW43_LITER
MGSGYFGEPIKFGGNERSSSSSGGSSSSSRKGKKSNTSEKPKQPQRGLGVAQLEKIRLHSQLTLHHNPYSTNNNISQEDIRMQTTYNSTTPSFSYSSSSPESYGFPAQQNFMMGLNERGNNIMYQDSQPSSTFSRWPPGNVVQESQHFAQPIMTRHFLNPQAEDFLEKRRETDRRDSRGSSNQYSETNGSQDLDLELRLSI